MLNTQYQKFNYKPTMEELRQNVHRKGAQAGVRVGVGAMGKT